MLKKNTPISTEKTYLGKSFLVITLISLISSIIAVVCTGVSVNNTHSDDRNVLNIRITGIVFTVLGFLTFSFIFIQYLKFFRFMEPKLEIAPGNTVNDKITHIDKSKGKLTEYISNVVKNKPMKPLEFKK